MFGIVVASLMVANLILGNCVSWSFSNCLGSL